MSKVITASLKNRNTTVLGAISLLITVLYMFQDYLGGVGIDWSKYLTDENMKLAYGVIISLIGFFSRDSNKSSQQSEIRDPLPSEPDSKAVIADAFGTK